MKAKILISIKLFFTSKNDISFSKFKNFCKKIKKNFKEVSEHGRKFSDYKQWREVVFHQSI